MTGVVEVVGYRSKRKRASGRPLPIRTALCEIRGDWKFLAECFHFNPWNANEGICWKCRCTPAQLRDVGSDATWRQPDQRFDAWSFLRSQIVSRGTISPLFEVPWLTNAQFRVDWLHCADQGVAADALGNIFKVLVTKVDGRTRGARVANIWNRMLAFYHTHNVTDRLPRLTWEMIVQMGQSARASRLSRLHQSIDSCGRADVSGAIVCRAPCRTYHHFIIDSIVHLL